MSESKKILLSSMTNYIEEKMKNFTQADIAEYSLRKRSYFNAFKMVNLYGDKLKDAREVEAMFLKDSVWENKMTLAFFLSILVADFIFNFMEIRFFISYVVAVGVVVLLIILGGKNEMARLSAIANQHQTQIDFYGYEMDRLITGNVSYQNEYMQTFTKYSSEENEEDDLHKKLYLASVDIAVINGMSGHAGVFDL
jgi:hypothetical protein